MFANAETLYNINQLNPNASIGTYRYNVNALVNNKNTNIKMLNINDLQIKQSIIAF